MPSPFDKFFFDIQRDFEKAARDLLKDVNREAAQNIREMLKEARRVNRLPPEPGPRAKGRGTRGRGKETGHRVTPPQLTLYDVLECSPRASQETLSAAFRSLSKKYHPDNYSHVTGSHKHEERYKGITAAWTVLKDPGKRKQYDRSIGL